MIIDKLFASVRDKSFVCVGLDTAASYVPARMLERGLAQGMFDFNKEIIDATHDIAGIYKLQIAHYEASGLEGLKAYAMTMDYLRSKDLLSIGDVKRGDISSTAEMYAKGHFEGDFEADFITLNPYMGYDSITPYMPYLESGAKGVFVLLRTSNSGAKDIEYLEHQGRPLYYTVGDGLEEIGKSAVGQCGYSSLGLVVGGTHSEEAVEIREKYANSFFLIPGYGAQGAATEDIRSYLNDFNGGVVNSSRGIIRNYAKYEDGEERLGHYARLATEEMMEDIYG